MTLHPDTKLTALVLSLVVLLTNVALAYFNITGTLTCSLAAAAPQMQAAAAGAIGK